MRDMNRLMIADSNGSKNSETRKYINAKAHDIETRANEIGCYTSEYKFRSDWYRLEYFAHKDKYETEADIPEDLVNTPGDIILDANMAEPRFTVYMMVGVPGAGKDWYIEHNLKKIPQLSRDLIRTEIGLTGEKPQGNKQQEEEVTRIFDKRMDEYLKNRTSFIINNTNTNKRYRDSFVSKILPYNARIIYVYCEAPTLNENFKRRAGMMPDTVIKRMWNEFEFPDKTEYYNIIYNVLGNGQDDTND